MYQSWSGYFSDVAVQRGAIADLQLWDPAVAVVDRDRDRADKDCTKFRCGSS